MDSESLSEAAEAQMAARTIQRAYRRWKTNRDTAMMLERLGMIDSDRNEIVEVQKKFEDTEEDTVTGKVDFRVVPVDSLVNIISYLGDLRSFLEFSKVTKHLHKVYKFNVVWNTFFSQSYPKVVEYILEKNDRPSLDKVNLKNVVIAGVEDMRRSYDHWFAELSQIREAANKLFGEKNFEASIEEYHRLIPASSSIKTSLRDNIFFEHFTSTKEKIDMYRHLIVINANCSQAAINEESWAEAYNSAKKAQKYLNIVKKMLPKPVFEENFEGLFKKVLHRLETARGEIMPLFRLVRYSEVPVEELRVGTMLTASDNISGDIFCDSKVLLYNYGNGEGVEGVIVNKSGELRDGTIVRIGGPCEMRTHTVILHNIPNVSDSYLGPWGS